MIAFTALLLAVLLLPGILFRYAYLRSNALRKTVDFSLLSELVFVLVPTLIIHLFGWLVTVLLSSLFGYTPDLITLYDLLSGRPLGGEALTSLRTGFPLFVLYILMLCLLASLGGKLAQTWVLRRGWDERYKLFQIFNDWDKYFTGHVVLNEERANFDYVQVDVVVGSSEGDILYSGSLANYSLNREQGIDRIFMEFVYRRLLKDDVPVSPDPATAGDREADPRYYTMPGDYLVIPFSQIKTLNLSYKKLKPPHAPPVLPAPA